MDLTKKNRDILIAEILKKAELRAVSADQVAPLLEEVMDTQTTKVLQSQENPKHLLESSAVRNLIKKVRAELRTRYGMFKLNKGRKIDKLLDELQKVLKKKSLDSQESLDLHSLLLASHRSTAERLKDYDSIYKDIFTITGKPKSILDLGCGLNPMSYPFMDLKAPTYNAREWAPGDVDILTRYFDIVGLKGSVERADLLTAREFPKADVCFLFKLIDVLENEKRGIARDLFASIDAKHLIISFATKTLGGQEMRTKRKWFTDILDSKGWTYQTIETDNEIFYVVSIKKE